MLGIYMGFEVAPSASSTRYSRIKPLTRIWNHLRLRTRTALHPFPFSGSTRCRLRPPIEPTSTTPRNYLLTLGQPEISPCGRNRPYTFESCGVRPKLGRIPKQLSKSHVRPQRDDFKVEQICLGYRERSDELLGFHYVITLQDQHNPRLVVRSQIELTHLVAFVALPHGTGLFAYVRID